MNDSLRQPVYVFEGFRLDAQRRVLFGPSGQPISLTPRLLDTLLYLVERAGQLLTKHELLEALWPNLVVEEHNLNKTMSELRRVLGEKPGEHKFIVTKPGRGYRFVAEVSIVSRVAAEPGSAERDAGAPELPARVPAPAQSRIGSPGVAGRAVWVTAAAAFTLLVVGFALLGNRAFAPGNPRVQSAYWSGAKGGHRGPVWSPDGREAAYAARRNLSEPLQLFVRERGALIPRSIGTFVNANIGAPAQWTTAGKILYWDQGGLWSVSPVGGPPELVRALAYDFGLYGRNAERVMDITRDGSVLASLARTDDGRIGVFTASLPDGKPVEYRPDPFAATDLYNNPFLRFSPDGKQLLLWWHAGRGTAEAWLLPFPSDASRPPRRVLEGVPVVYGTPDFSWLPDNRHIVVSAGPEGRQPGPPGLFVADTLSGGFAALLSSGSNAEVQPVVSPSGDELIYTEVDPNFDVVTVDLRTAAVTPMFDSDGFEQMPAWAAAAHTPTLVFVKLPNNMPEVWLHQPPQPDRPLVTSRDFPTETSSFLAPALSPDAGRVIYERVEGPNSKSANLWISAIGGGAPERLTNEDLIETAGSWSPDGNSYVYFAHEGEANFLKRVKTTGRAEPETLLEGQGYSAWLPVWSPDGQWILLAPRGILVAADGTSTRALGIENVGCAFAPREPLLHCIQTMPSDGRHPLVELDLNGKVLRTIGSLIPEHRPQTSFSPGLRLSPTPDGTGLTYTIGNIEQNLRLIEGLADVALP